MLKAEIKNGQKLLNNKGTKTQRKKRKQTRISRINTNAKAKPQNLKLRRETCQTKTEMLKAKIIKTEILKAESGNLRREGWKLKLGQVSAFSFSACQFFSVCLHVSDFVWLVSAFSFLVFQRLVSDYGSRITSFGNQRRKSAALRVTNPRRFTPKPPINRSATGRLAVLRARRAWTYTFQA